MYFRVCSDAVTKKKAARRRRCFPWRLPQGAKTAFCAAFEAPFALGLPSVRVTLTALPSGKEKVPKPVTVTVPAGRSTSAADRFASAVATSCVLAVSSGPPIVAASAAFSEGQHGVGGFAVATGVVDRADGRRQPDPLGLGRQQLVQPLQRQRQMRAALGTGDGVNLIHDRGARN